MEGSKGVSGSAQIKGFGSKFLIHQGVGGADANSLARFDALAGEFVHDAGFAHNMAEALDSFVIGEVGAAGELFDTFADHDESLTLSTNSECV